MIPIILRPCDWQSAPFGKFKALPTDGKPVTKHQTLDDAFLDITRAIREVIQQLRPASPAVGHIGSTLTEDTSEPSTSQRAQSSNLRVRQISRSTKISVDSIQKLLTKAKSLELTWLLPDNLDDNRLARLFYLGADTHALPTTTLTIPSHPGSLTDSPPGIAIELT